MSVPWWSPTQLARRYGVSRQTIYSWISSGRIPKPTPHPSGGYYWHEQDLPAPALVSPKKKEETE